MHSSLPYTHHAHSLNYDKPYNFHSENRKKSKNHTLTYIVYFLMFINIEIITNHVYTLMDVVQTNFILYTSKNLWRAIKTVIT
jgi:hypothetical protein